MEKALADLRAEKASMETDWESAADELEWLWTQVAKFARNEKVNHTVLMVIEPEPSKGSWETWVERDGVMITQTARLLLTSAPFKVKGHDHCDFVMRWLTSKSRMQKVVNDAKKYPKNPFARALVVTTRAMQEVEGLKKKLVARLVLVPPLRYFFQRSLPSFRLCLLD